MSPRGQLVAHYRKLTPWPTPEKSWATAGDRGVQTYDTEYGRVGLGICFDIHTILEKYEPQHLGPALPHRLGRRRTTPPTGSGTACPNGSPVQALPDRRQLERR